MKQPTFLILLLSSCTNENSSDNQPNLYIPTFLLLFSLMFFFACKEPGKECVQKGQVNLHKSSPFAPKAIGRKHAKINKTQPTFNGLAENVHCGLLDKDGHLWFGTTGHGVFYYDGNSFTNFTVIDGLNSNDIWSIMEDSYGNLWIGTGRGVTLYDGNSFTNFTKDEPFDEKAIWSLLEDKKGRIWMATDYNGTYFFDGKSFTQLTSIDSIVNNSSLTLNMLMGITEDKAGNLWFSSRYGEGLSSFDGKTIRKYTAKEGISDSLFQSVIEDKSGTLWFGSRDHGVFSYDGDSFTHISDNNGPGKAAIYSILEDRKGNIWFTTERNGVYRFDGKFFKNYTTEDGLINNSVFSVVEDKAGNLWFGTRNVGLSRYDGKSFINFSE